MPIRPERKGLYPPEWPAISLRERNRAGWRCEECGVPNGELGGRLPDGQWLKALPTGTNGLSLAWPKPREWGWCSDGSRREWLKIVRIVLTVAHLDHDPRHCEPSNLRVWCQYHHLRYDAKSKAERRKERDRLASADRDLFDKVTR